jgi:Trk-type K+ transport system membrane component
MLGYTLTPDSMISFQLAVWPLLIGCFLIIAGNTGFPCFLRLIIWVFFKLCPTNSTRKETLAFLLDHPRRCFTLLFPSSATWWLFGILVILNGLDLFFFLVLDLGDNYISQIPVGNRFLDGLFQAVSTRTAGFAVTNLQLLHPAVLVSYLIMMYISVFPVAISIRRTNVYEEKSLGIYAHEEDEQNASFVGTSNLGSEADISDTYAPTVRFRFVVHFLGIIHHLYCRSRSDTGHK